MKSGIHDFNVTFIARLIQIAMVLGAQSCMAWCLGTEGRGSYAVCSLFSLLLILVFSAGCDIASVYFVASKRLTVGEGIVNAVVFSVLSSVLAIAAGLILMKLPLPFFDKAPRIAFYLALLSIPFTLFFEILCRLLTAVHQFRWFAIVTIVNGAGYLGFNILLLRFYRWGINGAVIAVTLSACISILLSLLVLKRSCQLVWARPTLRNLRAMLHYGMRYYVGKLSNQLNFQAGTIILAFFADPSEIGLFAVAMRLVSQVMILPDTLTTVMIPKSAADDRGKAELIAQCSRCTGLVCGFVLLLLFVFVKPLVNTVFSPAFSGMIPLVQIMCLGVLVRCTSKVFVPYFLGTNLPGIASMAVAVGTGVNLMMMCILLPRIGLSGAALSVVLSYFVSSTILTIQFARTTGLTISTVLFLNKMDLQLCLKSVNKLTHMISTV